MGPRGPPVTGLPGGAGDPTTTPSWGDPDLIAQMALKVLRMDQNHEDVPRVERAAVAAMELVDRYMDRADDPLVTPTPQPVTDAAVQVTVEVYRRKDAPFGVLQGFSDTDVGPVRIGSDALKGVESLLMPYSHRYGVA